MAMKTKKNVVIDGLEEKFVLMGRKSVDSKNRITLGQKILKLITSQTGVEEFQIFYGEEGDILLRPVINIPSKEAWIYRNSKILKLIREGLKEAKEGKIERVKNLDKFLKDL